MSNEGICPAASAAILIIVSGPPCTGKTRIASRISREFHIPLFSKDAIKERLYDALGWSDRKQSRKLGIAGEEILMDIAARQLAAGRPVILESTFKAQYVENQFTALIEAQQAACLQIQCRTEPAILMDRFRRRAASGERHPGHGDLISQEGFEEDLRSGMYEPLRIPGKLLTIDTSYFTEQINSGIRAEVKKLLEASA